MGRYEVRRKEKKRKNGFLVDKLRAVLVSACTGTFPVVKCNRRVF
jgi:hypothetical protein